VSRKAIILAGGFDQAELARRLRRENFETILLDMRAGTPAQAFVDKFYQISTLDYDAVEQVARKEQVDLVTTVCGDQPLRTVAYVSEKLGLPFYLSYETILDVTTKVRMKRRFVENNIPTSKFVVVSAKSPDLTSVKELNFPVVVKPIDNNGSKGVQKVGEIEKVAEAIKIASQYSPSDEIIVEEFVAGIEISTDVYVNDGAVSILSETVSDKIKENRDLFTIVSSNYPPIITESAKEKICAVCQKIADAFHIVEGPMFVQFLVDGDDVSVVEFSPRMGGGSKFRLIEVLSGVDIMGVYLDLILGKKTRVLPSKKVNFAYLKYVYCHPGVVDKYVGFKELKENGTLDDYFVYKTEGAEIVSSSRSFDRAAGYLITSVSEEQLQAKKNDAAKALKIMSNANENIMIY